MASFGAQDIIVIKLGFIVVVEKSDHGSYRRTQFFLCWITKRVMCVQTNQQKDKI
jgi:hypothetical protein